MNEIIKNIEAAQLKAEVPAFNTGDTVRVHALIKEGNRERVQVFEGTNALSLANTKTRLLGHPMELPLSMEMLGRVFSGAGRPIDGLGDIYAEKSADINGQPLNPVSRVYPRNYINTGISSIDCLMTLIRGQKLPIFSGSGLPHTDCKTG